MRAPDTTRPLARLSRLAVKTLRTRTAVYRHAAPMVSFTFDDPIDTACSRAAPILERHEARGTFYVSASLLGMAGPGRVFAKSADVADLHRRGHEIGCHTFSHAPVATLSGRALLAEADRNQAALGAIAPGLRLESFAYPFNATDLRAKHVLQRRYGSCRGGVAGVNVGRVDLGYLRAVELCDEMIDLPRVRAWVTEVVRRGGWLVFLTHGVTSERQAWRSTPALFEGAVAAAREYGVSVVTVRDAARRITAAPALSRAGLA